jgi:membrane-associated phospholipid phosphatase
VTAIARFVRWRWLAASTGVWMIFAGLSWVSTQHSYLPGDVGLARWMQSVNWGPLQLVFPLISWLSGTPGTVVAAAVVAVVALANWRALPFALVVELGATATYTLVNQGLQVPRPTPDLVRVTDHAGAYGWPSGHTSFAVVQVTLIMLVLAGTRLPRRALYTAALAGMLVVLLFVIERVYVGAHWPSQTLGGMLNAAGWLTLAIAVRWLSDPIVRQLGTRRSVE